MGTAALEHHLFLEHMRATLRHAVYACGGVQTTIASEIGISPGTLKRLLDGGDLTYNSWQRVLAWCERYGWEHAYAEQAALSLLVSNYPAQDRRRVREFTVRCMKHKLISTGHRLPVWMDWEMKNWPKTRRAGRVT